MSMWLGLIKNVPWGEVVGNAPKIADGARTFWNKVSKRIRAGDDDPAPAAEAPPEDAVAARLAALEAQVSELRAQLAASSDLLRSLAEQNEQLVARIGQLKRGLQATGWALLAVAGLALAALWSRF